MQVPWFTPFARRGGGGGAWCMGRGRPNVNTIFTFHLLYIALYRMHGRILTKLLMAGFILRAR